VRRLSTVRPPDFAHVGKSRRPPQGNRRSGARGALALGQRPESPIRASTRDSPRERSPPDAATRLPWRRSRRTAPPPPWLRYPASLRARRVGSALLAGSPLGPAGAPQGPRRRAPGAQLSHTAAPAGARSSILLTARWLVQRRPLWRAQLRRWQRGG